MRNNKQNYKKALKYNKDKHCKIDQTEESIRELKTEYLKTGYEVQKEGEKGKKMYENFGRA